MGQTTIDGLTPDEPLAFAQAAQDRASAHYRRGVPRIIQEQLDALHAASVHCNELARDVAGLLLVEGVEGVDGDYWDATITFQRGLREPTWTEKAAATESP